MAILDNGDNSDVASELDPELLPSETAVSDLIGNNYSLQVQKLVDPYAGQLRQQDDRRFYQEIGQVSNEIHQFSAHEAPLQKKVATGLMHLERYK